MPPSIYDPAAPPEAAPEPPPPRRFRWPADYYAGPTPEGVLPPWASYGCGAAALLILLLVFAAGAWLSRGGAEQVIDLSFGMTMGKLRGMYTPDVTEAQKKALEEEIETLRENVRTHRLPPARLTTLLETMGKYMEDEKVDSREAQEIVEAARRARARASLRGSEVRVSEVQSLREGARHEYSATLRL